jgi:hypothetical protein
MPAKTSKQITAMPLDLIEVGICLTVLQGLLINPAR